MAFFFFFQAEDGIRDAQESRGLGDVYKRQVATFAMGSRDLYNFIDNNPAVMLLAGSYVNDPYVCLLYTSDAADDLLCVDLGGRRIIKKKNNT